MYDLLIIGGGPGGLTAALYASRANLKVGIIEIGGTGGQLLNTELIENYPGYKSIAGSDLANEMTVHATEFGAEIIPNMATGLRAIDNEFEVDVYGDTLKSKAVIIATGSQHKLLNIENEDNLSGRGISYCAICDGAFFKEKIVTVVGGGDSAYEEAQYLSRYARKVNILVRNEPRAKKELIDRVEANNKIEVFYRSPIDTIKGDTKLTGVTYMDLDSNEFVDLATDGLFPYIGATPNTDFIDDTLNLDMIDGYIKINGNCETNINGLYAIGDVTTRPIRQVVIAAGDGAIAAQNSVNYIESL